uniref:IP04214p n=1 Tax=Drosophila melanogaster TaxID=7227 RepID=Q4V4N3_DROME|nr:IP04214p [Drosophila melanogaster]
MDGCHNDILAPLILAIMVANGHPLTLDEIVDELTAVINSQTELAIAHENIGDGKHSHKSYKPRRKT